MRSLPGIKFPRNRTAGFTLVEVMVAMAVFAFIIGGMVAVQIFGLRVYTLAATKLIATTSGRQTLNAMRDQIRSAQQVYVGTFTNSSFTQASGLQIGNALQMFTSTNLTSTNFVVFYQDPSTNEIFSYINTPANKSVLASFETNYYCFQAEDYQGNILTNFQNSPVICVTMSFSQWEYPIGFVVVSGTTNAGNAYDYYYLRTRIARRCKQ